MSDLQQIFGNGFDTGSVPPAEDFAAVPPGKYPVVIEKAEVKQTKKGDGHYIELQLSILDGPAKNRKVWDRINIQNPSQQCVEIGLRSLAALGLAVGLASVSDTSQLLNKVCIAHVKVDGENNSVRTYSVCGGNQCGPAQTAPPYTPTTQPQTQQQTQPAPTAAAGKPPWAR
jgi:hypothetical protein